MKKLKIMLLSFALLAIVGGALAFKARFASLYCTAPVNPAGQQANGFCTSQGTNVKTCPHIYAATTDNSLGLGNIGFFCYTTAPKRELSVQLRAYLQ